MLKPAGSLGAYGFTRISFEIHITDFVRNRTFEIGLSFTSWSAYENMRWLYMITVALGQRFPI
jgi:hypothetical protein